MSTHGRGGTHWPSGRSWCRLVPALLAAPAVALALGVDGASAQAAARSAPAASHGHESAQHGPQRDGERHRESSRDQRERPRPGRSAGAAWTSTGRPHSRGTGAPAQPSAGDAGPLPAAGVSAGVSAAVSAAPSPVPAAPRPPAPAPSPPGEVPPVITAPALALPAPPRTQIAGAGATSSPLNIATIASLVMAVAVFATVMVRARRRA